MCSGIWELRRCGKHLYRIEEDSLSILESLGMKWMETVKMVLEKIRSQSLWVLSLSDPKELLLDWGRGLQVRADLRVQEESRLIGIGGAMLKGRAQ